MNDSVFPISGNVNTAREIGGRYAKQYQSADPYPHICIDNFLDDDVLSDVLEDIAQVNRNPDAAYARPQERLKVAFNPEELPPRLRDLFRTFNARPFLGFLESMTGIKGLLPDPYFLGGGIHEVKNGGHLDIHADFNLHPVLRVERRVNVLIYLNKDWESSFGGQLEIWDKDMTHAVKKFDPTYGRCVVFNTNADSYHGNPSPVNHPLQVSRRSIALYYYTATWDESKQDRTTKFRTRPGSKDRFDWSTERKELVRDLCPPILTRLTLRDVFPPMLFRFAKRVVKR